MKTKNATWSQFGAQVASILVAVPASIVIVSWVVGQLLPAEIKELPASVRQIKQDLVQVKGALGIADIQPRTNNFAASRRPHPGNEN